MNNESRPPSPKRFQRLAQEILTGKEIFDLDLYYLCQENKFYKLQLDALLREPFEQAEIAKQQQEQARTEALRRLRQTLRRTCYRRRDDLYIHNQVHHNGHYLRLLRLKRNDLEKQSKWDKFVMDVIMYRITQAHSWIDHRHSKWMSDVIFNSNPFELATAWPEGSCCPIAPVMSKDWVMLKPPLPPTKIEVEASLRKRLRNYENALEAAYYKTLGITKPKPSVTTTNTNGIRTTTTADSGHTAAPQLTLEQWMGQQLQPPVSGEEEHQQKDL